MSVAPDSHEPWGLWNAAPGEDYFSAFFYTATEPYIRKRMTVTHMRLAEKAEAEARAEGYVPLPELPGEVIRYWAAENTLAFLNAILRYLAEKP